MKTCNQCGTQNEDNAQFCIKCNAPFNNNFNTSAYAPDPSMLQAPPQKKMKAWKIVLIVVACIIGLSIIVSMFSPEDESKSTSGNSESTSAVVQQQEKSNSDSEVIEESTEKKVPTEYKSALKKAKVYSDTMHMSKKEYMTN